MTSTTLLSECVTISNQGYSLRVIHVHVGEGIAHVQALGEGSGDLVRVCRQTSASRAVLGSSR